MKQILVYADSLSWGIIPESRSRFTFDKRWPGVLEACLNKNNREVRVIENCLNGRRTVWDDPFKDGRNGSVGLAQVIEMHSPLALVLIMLGTNDFQSAHVNNAWLSARGVGKLISVIRSAPIEPGMPVPDILVISPPEITEPKGEAVEKFTDAKKKMAGFNRQLEKIALEHSIHYFDAATVTESSRVDGIHLDEDQHLLLGEAIAGEVLKILKCHM